MKFLSLRRIIFPAIAAVVLLAGNTLSAKDMKKGETTMKTKGMEKQKIKGIVLPTQWKLFKCTEFSKQDAAAARFEDDYLIPFQGTKKVKAKLIQTAALLDLSEKKKFNSNDRAILAGTVFAEKPATIYIGMGADWWIDAYCNGRFIGGTDIGGNDNWPPTAQDRIFTLKLRAGRNDLTFFVKPGSGSWTAAVDFFEKCDDPDIPPRQLPEPGIAFAPYLTNPGASSVTINYLLNGRQPLDLEYRPAGSKQWIKANILRGGQIVDEANVLSFSLMGLKPDSTYEYRALRRLPPLFDTAEPEPVRTFRTYSGKAQKYSFFLIGDTQDTSKQKNLARIRAIQKAFPELNKCNFMVHVGDLHGVINHFRNDVFDSVMKCIPSETFIVTARGNHEFEGAEAQQWLEHFQFSNGKSYGMFRIGEVCYIVLDTGHHLPAGSDNCHNVHMHLNDLDNLLEEQKNWLKEIVKTPEFQSAKFRIVFAHVAPHGQKDSFRHMVPRTQKMVKDVFKKSSTPIDLWVAGHTHKYDRTAVSKEWGFPVVVVGGGGPGAGKKPGFALLFNVEPGRISMKALNTDGTVHDTLVIKK